MLYGEGLKATFCMVTNPGVWFVRGALGLPGTVFKLRRSKTIVHWVAYGLMKVVRGACSPVPSTHLVRHIACVRHNSTISDRYASILGMRRNFSETKKLLIYHKRHVRPLLAG